jgi:hypothetical protein
MKKSDQRIVHKRERAAERQVLAGGHSRLIRGDSWSHPSTLIANDDETRYPKPSKKKGKSKRRFQGCPDRPFWNKGKCECLEEEVTIRDWIWDREAGDYIFGPRQTIMKVCVWCGATQYRDIEREEPSHWQSMAKYRARWARERHKRRKAKGQ